MSKKYAVCFQREAWQVRPVEVKGENPSEFFFGPGRYLVEAHIESCLRTWAVDNVYDTWDEAEASIREEAK